MESWKLIHFLFGIHFVNIGWGFEHETRAVRFTPIGEPYVKLFGEKVFLLDDNRSWRALTFHKEEWLLRWKAKLQAA